MLVLSRFVGEKVCIGPDIEIMVFSISGGKVRLGIKAPQEVAVYREEVWNQIQREREAGNTVDAGKVIKGTK